jgi:hypothetical protein
MGFRFRRTFKIVPGVRLNLSRSGPSVSLGARGFHYTAGPKGTRTTIGLPGSGLSWSSYRPYEGLERQRQAESHSETSNPKSSPDSTITASSADPGATVFNSASIEQLVSGSTSELAPVLEAIRKRWRFTPILLASASLAFALAVWSNTPPAVIGTIVFAVFAWPTVAMLDRHRLTITLDYDLQANEAQKFNNLVQKFQGLAKCRGVVAQTDGGSSEGLETKCRGNAYDSATGDFSQGGAPALDQKQS